MTTLAPTLQAFFTDRLARQRQASPNTIAAYRDALKLLLAFTAHRTGKQPSDLEITDLDAPLIGAFLDHLETERGNGVRTRNARLATVHALSRFAALRHPEHAAVIQRVLAIPPKRFDRRIVTYLTEPETTALLAAPDTTTWTGLRDHALLTLAIQTGLRVSELSALTCADIRLGTGAHVNCLGKGRKQRITPLTSSTIAVISAWLTEHDGQPGDPLFPTRHGTSMSRDAIDRRLAKHAETAAHNEPALAEKKISPHVLRHTAAMRLLAAGVDTTVIALWLGHESVATTQIYIHADLTLKEQALARTAPLDTVPGRYRPSDTVMAFLESLCLIVGNALTTTCGLVLYFFFPKGTTQPRRRNRRGIPQGLRDLPFLAVSQVSKLTSISDSLITVGIPLWIVAHTRAPHAFAAWLIIVNTLLVAALQTTASRPSETLRGASRSLVASFALLSVACILLSVTSALDPAWVVAGLVVVFLLLTGGEMLGSAASWAMRYELSPPDAQGEYGGVSTLGTIVPTVVGPLLVTQLPDRAGGPGWLVLAAVFAVGLVLAVPVIRWAESTRPWLQPTRIEPLD